MSTLTPKINLWKKPRYTRIPLNDVSSNDSDEGSEHVQNHSERCDEASESLIEKTFGTAKGSTTATKLLLCQASVNLMWTLSLFVATILLFTSMSDRSKNREYHDTDIRGARPLISTRPVRFTAGLYWNESDPFTTIRTWNVDEPIYVGPRTPELDAAWDAITLPLDVFITDDEARAISSIPQPMYRDPATGKYMGVVEATHSIHCLNLLRQRIYLDDYPELARKVTMDNHVDHCIEALRQNLMCTADMTVAPYWYSPTIDKVQPNFEIVHTCRDFGHLVDWIASRRVHPASSGHAHDHGTHVG